jgi:ATP-dependent helicase HepA
LVLGAIELVTSAEMGNTSVVALALPDVSRGTIVLESVYILESPSTQGSNTSRYLPPTTIRIMIDQSGKRLDHLVVPNAIDDRAEKLKPEMTRRIAKLKENLLRKMVDACDKYATRLAPELIKVAKEKSTTLLANEVSRLEELKKVNPNVRQEEIDFYNDQLDTVTKKLDSSSLRMDAMRVIVAT